MGLGLRVKGLGFRIDGFSVENFEFTTKVALWHAHSERSPALLLRGWRPPAAEKRESRTQAKRFPHILARAASASEHRERGRRIAGRSRVMNRQGRLSHRWPGGRSGAGREQGASRPFSEKFVIRPVGGQKVRESAEICTGL